MVISKSMVSQYWFLTPNKAKTISNWLVPAIKCAKNRVMASTRSLEMWPQPWIRVSAALVLSECYLIQLCKEPMWLLDQQTVSPTLHTFNRARQQWSQTSHHWKRQTRNSSNGLVKWISHPPLSIPSSNQSLVFICQPLRSAVWRIYAMFAQLAQRTKAPPGLQLRRCFSISEFAWSVLHMSLWRAWPVAAKESAHTACQEWRFLQNVRAGL